MKTHVITSFRMPTEQYATLKRLADHNERSVSGQIRHVMAQWIETEERDGLRDAA